MSLLAGSNRVAMGVIEEHLPQLARLNLEGTRGEWTSHVPVLPLGHIALDFASTAAFDRRNYEAEFFAEVADGELRVGHGPIANVETKTVLQPGLMQEIQDGRRRTVEIVTPGQVDGFTVTGDIRTGLVVAHAVINGEEQSLPALTEDVNIAQLLLVAFGCSIKSLRVGKFREPETDQVIYDYVA